ncbi:MAG: adenylate kinase [Bacilli bacterium]
MRLLIMGPPGAGKGTQAELIKKEYKIPHISTGDMFRDAMATESILGVQAKKYIDRGELVPDDLTISIVKERLTKDDCQNGFLLDGFPRTIVQAIAFDKMLKELKIALDVVLNIEASYNLIKKRIAGRRVCSNCKAGYHIENIKPLIEGVCDKCGGELIVRKDDLPETVEHRLNVYDNLTRPLVAYYDSQGLVKSINGEEEICESFLKVKDILGGINDNLKK